jgi:hypothetical protein
VSDNPFPKDWHRFMRAAQKKLTGEELAWCMEQATAPMPLTRLTDAEAKLFASLEDSQTDRIARGIR